MTELSDAEVMTPPHELSDAEVSAPPAPITAGGGRNILPLAAQVAPHVERVMEAFGHGFREGFGPDKLGLSDESAKWLSDKKIFGPAQGGYDNPLQAANELLFDTVAGAADIVARGTSGVFRGAQASVFTGLGEGPFARDIAAMPEAFFGSPHPTGTPKGLPEGVRPIEAAAEGASRENIPIPEAPPEKPPLIDQARELGVIGPEKPPVTEGTPAEAAEREVPRASAAAARTGDDVVRGPEPSEPEKAGNIRLDQIGINQDAKEVILDAAKNNEDFNQARAGDVPLAQVESLAGASGVPSEVLSGNDGLGRLMHNDAVVRTWLQAFHQASDEIAGQLATVRATGDEADIAKLREMKLRFQHMQEQVSGLTAEAGRTLRVFRDFYEQKGKAEGIGKLLEDHPGNDVDSLKKLADVAGTLDPRTQLPRFLHDANKPTFWDKYLYYWVNALISGPVTHAKYIGANAAFGLYEAGVVTPIAGALGTARRALSGARIPEPSPGTIRLYRGEGAGAAAAPGQAAHAGSAMTGGWFTTDLAKAKLYGDVKYIDVTKDDMKHFVGGHGGPDEYVTDNSRFRAESKPFVATISNEGVYVGEAAARTWGLLAGTPDALKAAWTAARENMMTPLPGEAASSKTVNPLTQIKVAPIGGKVGYAIGIPGRSAAGIHTFFRFLGYRAEIEAQAYRAAAKEGYSPVSSGPPPVAAGDIRFYHGTASKDATGFTGSTFVTPHYDYAKNYRGGPNNVLYADMPKDEAVRRGLYDETNGYPRHGPIDDGAAILKPLEPETTGDSFWQRYQAHAANPTEAMIDAGVDNGNHLTFIGEQGTFGQAVSKLANTRMGPGGMQPFKLILPFTHIPGQILRAGLEQTPAAFLDTKMRADLMGQNGAVAADTARARLVAGGAVSAMVANWAVNDNITGYGPTDPSERARWLRSHEPYSVRLGGWWYSYNKFGPIGTLVGLVANLVEVGPKVKEDEYAEAAGHVIKATARMLEDEVGMQGLVNLIDALSEPDRKMGRFVAGQAASNLPYSSLLRQSASITDPYMREAKTFVDQLRYQVPYARQDLLPKRDWLGQPVENPGYGNIIRQRAVNTDPIDLAVGELRGFKPSPPQPRIGGVALPPKMYDEYQDAAGAMTRVALERMVTAPGWGEMPPGIREQILHATVESMRKTAGAMTQARHPEIIMQGLQDRQDKIQGVKKTKLKE